MYRKKEEIVGKAEIINKSYEVQPIQFIFTKMKLKDYKDSSKEILKKSEGFEEQLVKAEEKILEEKKENRGIKSIDVQQLFLYSKTNNKI